jgi:sulfoxide reductase heme-binding subunit YedZ
MTVEQRYRWVYKPLVWLACLAPLLIILAAAVGVPGASLTADPVRETVHRLGRTALNLLLITLCVTPLQQLLRQPQLLRLRRLLGLFAFSYALLHFAAFAALDLRLDLGRIGTELVRRPYILVGFTALLALLPLAVTSTRGMMRRLGRRWATLHRLVYPVAVLAVWHFWWQVKADITEPLLYSAALALLLGYRGAKRRRATSMSAPATVPGKT